MEKRIMDIGYKNNSYKIVDQLIQEREIKLLHSQLLKIGNNLDTALKFHDLDDMWNHFKLNDRRGGASIYNGFKYLPSISIIANSSRMKSSLKKICGINNPALIDINCRIDSSGEEKYLFDWHQDYWFSLSSRNAVVVWIPISGLEPSKGGLDIIPVDSDHVKIYKTKPGNKYDSYADAVLLEQEIPYDEAKKINHMDIGSALFFSFSSLHKSLPITSHDKSRFTVQLRFADFDDSEFISNQYRPGQVTKESTGFF
jgi:hypothetical protein